MPVSPASPTPTPPRPAARPMVKPPPPKKSSGSTIGLIIASVLAVAGLGGAGYFYTQQGPLKQELEVHRSAAIEAARAANIPVPTNAPDWAKIWPSITTTFATLRNENDRQTTRLREMEQELEVAAGLQANLQTAQANAQRSAQQATAANEQLETVRAESARKIADLEKRLAAAVKEAEEAKALAAAAPVAAPVAAPAGEPGVASAPVAAEPAAAAPDAVVEETPAAAPAAVAVANAHEFPGRRSELLAAASYSDESQTMTVRLQNGTELRYENFPRDLYEAFVTSPTFETFYRIKIMGLYPSTPDDKAAVRAHRKR